MDALSWQAWATLAAIAAMLVALVREMARPDLVVVGAAGVLVALGILTPQEAFAGFSNGAVIAVASLFVIAAAVQNTGAIAFADRLMFPRDATASRAMAQMGLTVGVLSAFLNNTPLVAMTIPRARAWCERTGVSPSKLLIPLSYAAILGGATTLVGTSTNLVVSGLMEEEGAGRLGLFTQTPVAIPAAIAAFAVLVLLTRRVLPDRAAPGGRAAGLARYLFELRVAPGGPLDGLAVEAAGLRSLGDAFLAHVRSGTQLAAAAPETILHGGDVLLFRGSAESMGTLLDRPGLERIVDPVTSSRPRTLPLFEAVVAAPSVLVGKTLHEAGFRERYGGVVLAVGRGEGEVGTPLRQTPLRTGDLLLVEADGAFLRRWGKRHDEFYLVTPRRAPRPRPQPGKAPFALLVLLGAVVLASVGVAPIETTAFVGALALIVTRCLSGREARQAIEVPTLVVIAASLGVGHALETTGLAASLAEAVVGGFGGMGPVAIVAAVYLATMVLTELITNNAAAALMVGVGLETASRVGVPPEVFGVTVALAASASFLTPIGYQTNLMVMAAGGYRFADYWRAGLPVTIAYSAVAIGMIAWLWL